MSIEQKIAEILAESKTKTTAIAEDVEVIAEDEVVSEETSIDEPSDGSEQNEANKKNNVDKQSVDTGSKASNANNKDEEAPEAKPAALSMKEDLEALTAGEELSEEFKEKAATIFEAAVLTRVKQEVAKLDEAYDVKLAEEVEQIKEGLVEKVDGYLDYVVEQWMEQNEIALERGMKSEILEGFVGGLKSLFEEHYIDIPEEKFDVLGTLEEQVAELTTKLDEQVASNVQMNKELSTYQVAQITAQLSEGLAETDKEKFHALVEELEFDGVQTFEKKAQTIRESYFTNKATTKSVVESVVTDTPVSLTEETTKYVAPQMKGYMSVLDNLK